MSPEDQAEAARVAVTKLIAEQQARRKTAIYWEALRCQAGTAVDRYKALREAGMDRMDALVLAGQVFL